jgi:hypothetical protein
MSPAKKGGNQMENRDRDKMSKKTESTSAGDVNRKTSSDIGHQKSDSSADFGQKIGRSEDIENEPSRKSGGDSSGMQSDSGRSSGSSGFDSSSDRSSSSDFDDIESGRSGNRGGSSTESL